MNQTGLAILLIWLWLWSWEWTIMGGGMATGFMVVYSGYYYYSVQLLLQTIDIFL